MSRCVVPGILKSNCFVGMCWPLLFALATSVRRLNTGGFVFLRAINRCNKLWDDACFDMQFEIKESRHRYAVRSHYRIAEASRTLLLPAFPTVDCVEWSTQNTAESQYTSFGIDMKSWACLNAFNWIIELPSSTMTYNYALATENALRLMRGVLTPTKRN